MEAYISDSLRKGYPESQIRKALLRQGYSFYEINNAMANAMGANSPRPVQPVSQGAAAQNIQQQPSEAPRKMKLKRVSVFSSLKVCAITGALFGLVIGILIFAGAGMLLSMITPMVTTPGSETDVTGVLGLGLLIGGPLVVLFAVVVGGVGGLITGALGALIYNLIASRIGGFEIELE